MQLNLTLDQASTLSELLETAIGDLHVELRHTDAAAYKEVLHRRAAQLRAIFEQLPRSGALVG